MHDVNEGTEGDGETPRGGEGDGEEEGWDSGGGVTEKDTEIQVGERTGKEDIE